MLQGIHLSNIYIEPLEKWVATYSNVLAWRIPIPWTEEPGGLQSMGSQRVRHNWATNTHFFHKAADPRCSINTSMDISSAIKIQLEVSCFIHWAKEIPWPLSRAAFPDPPEPTSKPVLRWFCLQEKAKENDGSCFCLCAAILTALLSSSLLFPCRFFLGWTDRCLIHHHQSFRTFSFPKTQ